MDKNRGVQDRFNNAWKSVMDCWHYSQSVAWQGGYQSYIEALRKFNETRREIRGCSGLSYSCGYFRTVRGSLLSKQRGLSNAPLL